MRASTCPGSTLLSKLYLVLPPPGQEDRCFEIFSPLFEYLLPRPMLGGRANPDRRGDRLWGRGNPRDPRGGGLRHRLVHQAHPHRRQKHHFLHSAFAKRKRDWHPSGAGEDQAPMLIRASFNFYQSLETAKAIKERYCYMCPNIAKEFNR